MGTTRLSAEGGVGRGLSPEIWQAYGFIGGNFYDPSRMGFFFDDFAHLPVLADGDATSYAVHIDATGSVQAEASVDLSEGEFGVCRFSHDAGDNDQVSIQMGGNVGTLVKIDDTAGENGVVAFECRVKCATVTTGDVRLFFGLAEEGCSADNAIFADDAATFGDKDYIGFMIKEADGASLIRQFHKASGTADAQDTGDDMVADTWIKLGFVYDPDEYSDRLIKFYVDGSECTNFGDVRCDSTDLADDTNFPAGEEMAPLILLKAASTAANTDYLYIDWWAVGQGFTGGV
jgi:hypothetical protein